SLHDTNAARGRSLLACALGVIVAATAVAAGPKLNGRDYDRLQAAQVAAGASAGLVLHRGCDPDAVACISKATGKEIALARRAANRAKSLLPKRTKGPCRQAVAVTFSAWNKRVGSVAAAPHAWQGHLEWPYERAAPSGSKLGEGGIDG